MYKVMIVDDEPPIIRNIKRALEKYSNNFEVVAEAYNGCDALEKIMSVKPDIVFTDIKMPVMDGLALTKKLNAGYPEILSVIISGYEDFNYAKEALKTGVVDYLLKPVEPFMLSELLDHLSIRLDKIYHAKEKEFLQNIIHSNTFDATFYLEHLNYNYFYGLVVRNGSLPGRHSKSFSIQDCSFLKSPDIHALIPYNSINKFWVLNGKDENEAIVLFASMNPIQFQNIANTLFLNLSRAGNCITEVFSSIPFKLNMLSSNIQQLFLVLQQFLVIGKSQLLDAHNSFHSTETHLTLLGSSLENKLNFMLQSMSFDLLKDELLKLFQHWEEKALPQICVEKLLKQIARLIEKNSSYIPTSFSISIEQQLEEVLAFSTDYGSLLRGVWDIFEDILRIPKVSNENQNVSEELFQKIEAYVRTNLSEPLTLHGICQLFGISQPYLSRLFRRHTDNSFNEYITNLRINEAKRLIKEHPGMLLKDIGEIVGYQDQHYFSRIFKSITGVTPSEFNA